MLRETGKEARSKFPDSNYTKSLINNVAKGVRHALLATTGDTQETDDNRKSQVNKAVTINDQKSEGLSMFIFVVFV